jgi:hypothetical protein
MHLLILSLVGCLPKTDTESMVNQANLKPACTERLLSDGRCVPNDLPYCDQFEVVAGITSAQVRLWCLPPNSSTRVDLPKLIEPDDQPGIAWYTVPANVAADFVKIGMEDGQVFALINTYRADGTVTSTQICDVTAVQGTNRSAIDHDIPCMYAP